MVISYQKLDSFWETFNDYNLNKKAKDFLITQYEEGSLICCDFFLEFHKSSSCLAFSIK